MAGTLRVNHRVGGLEVRVWMEPQSCYVNHRVGGLTIVKADIYFHNTIKSLLRDFNVYDSICELTL